jgi:hypothetical protein
MQMTYFTTVRAALAAALLLVAAAAQAGASGLEEEQVNPSEVTFENGVPYYYDGGQPVRLSTRRQGGETIYYRLVRYDAQEGYVGADGRNVAGAATHVATTRSAAAIPGGRAKYYGNGLYGPDYYQSPYNRDARKHYSGPGYYGTCDWRGCKEVQYAVPVYGYYYP